MKASSTAAIFSLLLALASAYAGAEGFATAQSAGTRSQGISAAAESPSNPLAELLKIAQDKGGRLEATLDDGTKILFRKDFGAKAHPISPNYLQDVDHYNIEIHIPDTGRAGRFERILDTHIIVDKNGQVIDIVTKK